MVNASLPRKSAPNPSSATWIASGPRAAHESNKPIEPKSRRNPGESADGDAADEPSAQPRGGGSRLSKAQQKARPVGGRRSAVPSGRNDVGKMPKEPKSRRNATESGESRQTDPARPAWTAEPCVGGRCLKEGKAQPVYSRMCMPAPQRSIRYRRPCSSVPMSFDWIASWPAGNAGT
jgi:hypothetical protein